MTNKQQEEKMDVAKKWKPQERETEYIQIAGKKNAIRTNHIKARIDKTQENCRRSLYRDIDERGNHIISECSKLSQKD